MTFLASLPRAVGVLLAGSVLAVVAAAQDEGRDVPPPKPPRPLPGQLTEAQLESGMTEADIDRTKPYVGSTGYCAIHASVEPRRLTPGQTGTMVLTMLFEKDWVMTAPANLSFDYKPFQNPFHLGAPKIRPARLGSTGSIFDGKLVYDRYAVIDVPIRVEPDAPHLPGFARVKVQFDITDGNTGKLFQRFEQQAGCRIEIGEPIPEGYLPELQNSKDDPTRPPPGAPGSELLAAPVGGTATTGSAGGSEVARSPAVTGARTMDAERRSPEAGPARRGPGEPLTVDEGLPWPMLLAGGGLLLVVLVLVGAMLGKR